MLFKNVAGQKIHVYAYDSTTGAAKTGDAANITAYVSLDGTANAIDDTNPAEVDATNMPGVYVFDMAQAETNCNSFALYAKSSTSNIRIEPIIGFTTGAAVPSAVAGAAGGLFIAGSNAATTVNITGTVSGNATTAEIADVPTVAEFEARTLAAAAYATAANQVTIASYIDTEIGALTTAVADLPTNAELATAFATAWSTTTIAEDYPADNTAATPAELLYLILSVCSQFAISSTTLTTYKLDGTTTAATYALDSATAPTQRIRAT